MSGIKREALHEGQRERFRELISELAVSENGFTKRVGISANYFFQFREKKSALTMRTLAKIKAAVVNLNPEWLRTGEGAKTTDGKPFRFSTPGESIEQVVSESEQVDTQSAAGDASAYSAGASEAYRSGRVGGEVRVLKSDETSLRELLDKYEALNYNLSKRNIELQERVIELTEKALRQQETITRLLQEKVARLGE